MKYKVTLNNRVYEVVVEKGEAIVESEYEAVQPKLEVPAPAPVQTAPTASPVAVNGGNTFNAPLPGTVVAIKCEVGKSYKSGDVLFVVESMKMENDVTLDKDATITAILVTKGQNVSSGTPMCNIK